MTGLEPPAMPAPSRDRRRPRPPPALTRPLPPCLPAAMDCYLFGPGEGLVPRGTRHPHIKALFLALPWVAGQARGCRLAPDPLGPRVVRVSRWWHRLGPGMLPEEAAGSPELGPRSPGIQSRCRCHPPPAEVHRGEEGPEAALSEGKGAGNGPENANFQGHCAPSPLNLQKGHLANRLST